jgi:alpha-1,3/alpha-1,6-mannosyltransferase
MEEKRVLGFIHPDLGIGGAERLILDAAIELQRCGHKVHLYTAYHDLARCFEDTLHTGGKRCDWIHVSGSWIPRHFFGFFHIFFANLRCFWLSVNSIFITYNYSIVHTADSIDIL